MLKNFLLVLILIGTPATTAAHDASCESHLLSSFHMLVESAHKSGDLTIAQIADILKSDKPVNPFAEKGLQAHQAVAQKAVDRLIGNMAEEQWKTTQITLRNYLDRIHQSQAESSVARKVTRGVLNPRHLVTFTRGNVQGFQWISADPPTLALHVKKLSKSADKIGINGIFRVEMIQPKKPQDLVDLEAQIGKLVKSLNHIAYKRTADGTIDIVDFFRSTRVKMIRLDPSGRTTEYPIKVNLGRYETISSASIAHMADGEPLVVVTTDSKIFIYRPIDSAKPVRTIKHPEPKSISNEQLADWLNWEGENPLLLITTFRSTTSISDPFHPNHLNLDFNFGLFPKDGSAYIADSRGQVYVAVYDHLNQVAVFSMYHFDEQSPEVRK